MRPRPLAVSRRAPRGPDAQVGAGVTVEAGANIKGEAVVDDVDTGMEED